MKKPSIPAKIGRYNINKRATASADTLCFNAEVTKFIDTIDLVSAQKEFNEHFPWTRIWLNFTEVASIQTMMYFEKLQHIPDQYVIYWISEENHMMAANMRLSNNEWDVLYSEAYSPVLGRAVDPSHDNNLETRNLTKQAFSLLCDRVCKAIYYINNITVFAEPIEERVMTTNRTHKYSNKKKSKRYISTKKYVFEKVEKVIKPRSQYTYEISEWEARGHWRKYKNGKKVWIKPQKRYRNKEKLSSNHTSQRSREITVTR